MLWRRAEESNPHPGLSQSAGFRDQKALPSLRALRWSESRVSNPVRTVLRTVASTTSASPTWHTREELNPDWSNKLKKGNLLEIQVGVAHLEHGFRPVCTWNVHG